MVGMMMMMMVVARVAKSRSHLLGLDWPATARARPAPARAMTTLENDAKPFRIRENFATPIALQMYLDM